MSDTQGQPDFSRARLDDLVAELFDGELTDEQSAELRDTLSASAAARRRYLELTATRAHLRWLSATDAGVSASAPSGTTRHDHDHHTDGVDTTDRAVVGSIGSHSTERALSGRGRTTHWSHYAAAAVFLFAAALAVALLSRGPSTTDDPSRAADGQPVATLTDTRGVTFADNAGDLSNANAANDTVLGPGSMLDRGPVRINSGVADMIMRSTATVSLMGPADFELINDNRVRLTRGRLLAYVPEAAHGFAVETPTATVVDRGTYFSVTVDATGATEVSVYEGRVDTKSTGRPTVTAVTAGQTARVADAKAAVTSAPIQPSDTLRTMFKVSEPTIEGGFERGGYVVSGSAKAGAQWNGDRASLVDATADVVPFEGRRMLRFDATSSSASAEHSSCEVYRVIDVADMRDAIDTGRVIATVTAQFNRVAGGPQTDTEFGIQLFALRKADIATKAMYDNARGAVLISDADPATWQPLSTSMRLPTGVDCVIIRIRAVENVHPDSVAPEFDGHYVDGVTLRLLTAKNQPDAPAAIAR